MSEGANSLKRSGRDYFATFGVGEPGAEPHPVDVGGVILSSIQGLNDIARRTRTELDELRARTKAAIATRAAMKARVIDLKRPRSPS